MAGDVTTGISIEDLERMPDDGWRYELVRGRLVREPPAGFEHGRITIRVGSLLHRFVEERGLGAVATADPGFVLEEDPPTVRAPDVAFVARERLPEGPITGFARFAPDLAVEVVSPSDRTSEVHEKVLDWLDAGTRLVWVVDPAARAVISYRSREDVRILRDDDALEGGDVLPGYVCKVSELFDR